MTQIIDIRRVEIAPKSLTARVRIAMGAPLMTSEDLEGTTRVYRLLPEIVNHVCLGDVSETFKDVMGDTEVAHLLEHVTVELLAQTNLAGDVTCGRTYAVEDERRTYDVEFPCPDDVLVAGALSSAVWILQWAYTGGGEPEPDVAATVQGLAALVQSLPEPAAPAPAKREYVVVGKEAEALVAELNGEEDASDDAEALDEDAEADVVVEQLVVEEIPAEEKKSAPVTRRHQFAESEVDEMLGAVHKAVEAHTVADDEAVEEEVEEELDPQD